MPECRVVPSPSTDSLLESLLGLHRSTSSGGVPYLELQGSPLRDLAPLAQPGLASRVTKSRSVGKSLDALSHPFTLGDEADTVVKVHGGCTGPLLRAAAVAVLPALQYGFNNGNMNTAAAAMRADLGLPAGSGDSAWGFCVSVFCLGALQGCSAGAALADALGRRRALLMSSAAFALGALAEAASVLPARAWPAAGVALMVLGRAVSGAAAGATTVVVPMYLGEVSPPHLRGALGTLFQLTAGVAMLAAQVAGLPSALGTQRLWPLYLSLAALPAAALLLLQGWLLESPRWLVGRGDRLKEAQGVVAQLRGEAECSPAVKQELELLQEQSGGCDAGYGMGQALRDSSIRPGLVVCICCAVVQQFSGINNAFNYSSTFLVQNGISVGTVTIITVLMNVGNVLVTLLSTCLMDREGRRTLLLGSSVGMLASILGLTVVLTSPGRPWTAPCAVLAVVSFVASFGVGLGPIPWLLPAELFPVDKCATGSALSASCNWLANFAAGQAFLPLSTALQGWCFLPFALVLSGFVRFVLRSVPETRGKTLEQIMDEMRSAKVPMPRSPAAPSSGVGFWKAKRQLTPPGAEKLCGA